MMELAAIESRRALDAAEPVALRAAARRAGRAARGQPARRAASACRSSSATAADAGVEGDALPAAPRGRRTWSTTRSTSRPSGGAVDVALARKAAHASRCSVRDHGPGIPDYAADKVFEKFYSLARPHYEQARAPASAWRSSRRSPSCTAARVTLRNAATAAARWRCWRCLARTRRADASRLKPRALRTARTSHDFTQCAHSAVRTHARFEPRFAQALAQWRQSLQAIPRCGRTPGGTHADRPSAPPRCACRRPRVACIAVSSSRRWRWWRGRRRMPTTPRRASTESPYFHVTSDDPGARPRCRSKARRSTCASPA